MSKRKYLLLAAAPILALGATLVWGAGLWSTLPVIGGSSFCASTVTGATGSICGQTVPAGPPALTGAETVPVDTGLAGGGQPSTAQIPVVLLGSVNAKENRLVGGDFATNLWQRGTSFASLTPTTTTMTADRFGVYSSANTVTVSKQTAAADTFPSASLLASMRVARPSGADVTPICVVQVLDQKAAAPFLGNNAVFSFYALAGANFSPTASNITATIAYYTAADSATPGTNTDAWAKGTVTGYTSVINSANSVASTSGLMPISATWTRYWISGPIPTATAAGVAVTGVGVSICNTPVGTAGANDWLELAGLQLQATPSIASGVQPLGVISPSGFQKREQALESMLSYYYSYILDEPISPTAVSVGSSTTTTNCKVSYPLPNVMRTPPTFTSGTITSPNNWEVRYSNTTNPVTAIATAGANTINQLSLNITTTGLTAGGACVLEGNNGVSTPTASAEP